MTKWWLMSVVAVCLVAAGGCRKASEGLAEKLAEKAIEKNSGGKADVDISGGKITVKTKDGEMVASQGGSASIPADFPKDVLVLKGAKVMATIKVPDGFSVTLESSTPAETVASQYSEAMKAKGWSEEASVNTGDGMMLAYSKEKENRSASIMVGKGGSGSQIVVTVSKGGEPEADQPNEAPAADAGE